MNNNISYLVFLTLTTLAVVLPSASLLSKPLQAKPATDKKPENAPATKAKDIQSMNNLSIREVLRFLLENNDDINIQQLELLKSDSEQKKNDSAYAPILGTGGSWRRNKQRYTNSFTSGDTTDFYSFYLRAKKEFITGTYFETELENRHRGSEAITNQQFGTLGESDVFTPARLHTSALNVVLRQELLKNAFGYNYRRQDQILRNKPKFKDKISFIFALS